MWSVGVPQDDGECGYPVASASVPRSGAGAGVHVEHPAAERHGPLPLDCYAFGADATGYARSVVIHHIRPLGRSRNGPARRRRVRGVNLVTDPCARVAMMVAGA
jgi:hypothetical protein